MSTDLVVEVAQGILSGKISIVEGARLLSSLGPKVTGNEFDPDFTPFVGIDSESVHIPLGEVRDRWSQEGLKKMDIEQKKIEEHYRDWAIEASEKLVERYARRDI